MFTALVLLASMFQPASLEIAHDGNRDCTVTLCGQVLQPGRVYVTPPFFGTRTVTLQVSWVDGDEIIRRNLTIELEAGYHHELRFNVPRANPNIVLVRGP